MSANISYILTQNNDNFKYVNNFLPFSTCNHAYYYGSRGGPKMLRIYLKILSVLTKNPISLSKNTLNLFKNPTILFKNKLNICKNSVSFS